MTITTVQL